MSKVWFTSGSGSAASLRRLSKQPQCQAAAAIPIQITFSRFLCGNLTFIYETSKKQPNYIALILNNIFAINSRAAFLTFTCKSTGGRERRFYLLTHKRRLLPASCGELTGSPHQLHCR
ncbi:hypothetical protein [Raoultella sp. BIGb0149]|uniref:hypothetical protein n=1 Tax=Raoultella sp. BIGb0149 TaxID=2485116 RepID=UPI00105CD862|nr:hypothetical protein [Raoultella sp. BIGb0149]